METLLDASAMVERRQESWCCLLCLRKFANQAHVQKHLAKSALHADNLASATAAGRITMPKEQHSALAMKRPREQALASSSSSGGDGVGSSGIATSNKLSAIEQMELFEKRLKVEAQRQPEKQIAARPNAEAEVDSTRARTINQQRDWECSGCSMVNFARVVVCGKCGRHVDSNTKYLTNRLKEIKAERFARLSAAEGGKLPEARADGSHPMNAMRASFSQQ